VALLISGGFIDNDGNKESGIIPMAWFYPDAQEDLVDY